MLPLDKLQKYPTVDEIKALQTNFQILKPFDCDGPEMSDLIMFLKRGSPLWDFKIGKAKRVQNLNFNVSHIKFSFL